MARSSHYTSVNIIASDRFPKSGNLPTPPGHSSDRLEIQTFGKVTLTWRNTQQPLSISPREEALLVYLAYQGITISRAQLCDLFWPGENDKRARGNLRKLLADMRKSLNRLILIDREEVSLVEQCYWLDVHEFQRHAYVLTQSAEFARPISEMDIRHLAEGVQLYHGTFLAHFKQPQSERFTTWIEEEERILHQQAVSAFKLLITHAIHTRQLVKAVAYTRRVLEIDPLNGESNAQLMRLLANQNQIADAITHYHRYEQLLKHTMRATVEPDILALHQQIRDGIVPILDGDPPAFPAMGSNGFTIKSTPLPNPLTPLIGRTMLLTQLHRHLQNPSVRLLTLTGLGGIGKTRVALALANQAQSYFPDGVLYIPLERSVPTPQCTLSLPDNLPDKHIACQTIARATAMALRLPIDSTKMPLEQQICLHLYESNLLLLFDSFEYFLAGTQFLVNLLEGAPLVKIVVASRELLQLPGEVVIQVEGLSLPSRIAVNEQESRVSIGPSTVAHKDIVADTRPNIVAPPMATAADDEQSLEIPTTTSAIQLFTLCAQRHNPNLAFTATCNLQIAKICDLLDGNPLAIELAAGLINHYTLTEIITLLREEPQVLQTSSRGLASRHQSMQFVFEESWRQLSTVEQETLVRLTLLPPQFSRARALQLAGILPTTLMDLTRKSLLRTISQGQYQLPQLVQLFASQKRHQFDPTHIGGLS